MPPDVVERQRSGDTFACVGVTDSFFATLLGGPKVKFIDADYASDKGQAINLANQAVNREQAVLVLGPTTTVDTLAVAPIFNESKTPFFTMGTSNQIITTGPWSFKFAQSGGDMIPMVAKYALEKTSVRKVAIIYDRNNDAMIEFRNFFRDSFKAGGGTVVTEEAVATNETNFLPLVSKLMAMDIDGVFFSTYAEQTANIMVQLRQAGLPAKIRFLGLTSHGTPRFVEIGGKAVEGTIIVSEFVTGIDRPLNKSFEAAYKARYKTSPDSWAALGYSMGQVSLAALKSAGPKADRDKVREALMKVRDVPVVVGTGEWNQSDRKPNYGALMVVVKDGKFVLAP
jgi:branched-chain amino acid transport system substrate-binding protein